MDAGHLWYALGWASFGALHSVLAAQSVKDVLPFGRWHRLAYNAVAAVHLGLLIWLGRGWTDGAPFDLPPGLTLAGDVVSLAGAVLIAAGLSGYDRKLFLGLSQVAGGVADGAEPLRTDGLHRYVRHPLYSGLFLVLWGQAQSEFGLATAAWASLYLLIGTWYEERRLLAQYGDAYAAYRRAVPAFIPWRGRWRPPGL